MKIREKTLLEGKYKITIKNKKTGEVKEKIVKNRLTDLYLNNVVSILCSTSIQNFNIKYLAFGVLNTAVSNSDTRLAFEIYRTPPTLNAYQSDVGQVTTLFTLTENELNGETIEEIGIFCGATATGVDDSGLLLSRILWHHVKSADEEIIFTRIDTCNRE
jgi:hypothetical protein